MRMGLFSKAVMLLTALASAPSAFAQPKELLIGALLPLTGPAAPIGIEERNGVQFAVDEVNAAGGAAGVPVRVIFDDSQGKPDQAVLSFNRMLDLHSVPVIITAYSSISLAIAPLATRREVLVVNPAAQTNKLEKASPFLINTIPLVNAEARVLARYAVDKIGKKAAIIYENAAAGIDGATDFRKYFEAVGGQIIAEEPVEFGQTNYRATLLKIAAAKPDFVYIAITQSQAAMADQIGQVANFPVGIGNTFSSPFFGFKSTEGWYQTGIQSGQLEPAKVSSFKEKLKVEEMGFFAREYYNATKIILKAAEALIASGRPVTGAALRDKIQEIKTFSSPVATITFEDNNASRPVEILQYRGDKRVLLEAVNPTR
ncbi:ABC-type branched-subunit amino acid transport system substrate-binding protein [Chelatococcus asaccharovorans]|uniref:ABC-type branched-subunit amino acid transport system substrate-binding protein n=2 Tax=Chelatococcus asaccharovorans TaxID=28210 RepID=A0A2V3TZ06_9HYPH|nr:ABC transporter substrate-binding protein [Chelatococcus asaccharovorans]PXW54195.1 ABC-type branched-subunit amino acid transport system substrate-binding protein [Chelatococcus asaccharovorans]